MFSIYLYWNINGFVVVLSHTKYCRLIFNITSLYFLVFLENLTKYRRFTYLGNTRQYSKQKLENSLFKARFLNSPKPIMLYFFLFLIFMILRHVLVIYEVFVSASVLLLLLLQNIFFVCIVKMQYVGKG